LVIGRKIKGKLPGYNLTIIKRYYHYWMKYGRPEPHAYWHIIVVQNWVGKWNICRENPMNLVAARVQALAASCYSRAPAMRPRARDGAGVLRADFG
jgi:hypothetical protein